MRIRGTEIDKVRIKEKTYSIYISYPKGKELPELRIGPLDMIRCGVDEIIAKKVIEKVNGELKSDNFGFNRVNQKVFAISMSGPRSSEEFCEGIFDREELSEKKEKLLQAMKDLFKAFDRLADMALVP